MTCINILSIINSLLITITIQITYKLLPTVLLDAGENLLLENLELIDLNSERDGCNEGIGVTSSGTCRSKVGSMPEI